jgi:hypothetical protein
MFSCGFDVSSYLGNKMIFWVGQYRSIKQLASHRNESPVFECLGFRYALD